MKQTYLIKDDSGMFAAAIADLSFMEDSQRWQIHRINVMKQFRRTGLGTEILQQILKDADNEGVKLWLLPVATGGLTQSQLVRWYKKHGFNWTGKPNHTGMERKPSGQPE